MAVCVLRYVHCFGFETGLLSVFFCRKKAQNILNIPKRRETPQMFSESRCSGRR
jgi:hypothetical protein